MSHADLLKGCTTFKEVVLFYREDGTVVICSPSYNETEDFVQLTREELVALHDELTKTLAATPAG